MHCPSSSRREWSLSADIPRPLARQSGVGGKRLRRTLGIKIKRTPEEVREQTRRRVQRFRERTRVVVIIAVLALALSPMPAGAREQPRSGAAMPFASPGNSPSGYYQSGGFCAPTNRDNRPAVPRPAGASCPSGWYQSGGACVRLNR